MKKGGNMTEANCPKTIIGYPKCVDEVDKADMIKSSVSSDSTKRPSSTETLKKCHRRLCLLAEQNCFVRQQFFNQNKFD